MIIKKWDKQVRKIQKMIEMYDTYTVQKITWSFHAIMMARTEGHTEDEDTEIALEKRIAKVSSEYNIPVEEIRRLLPKIKPTFVISRYPED